MTKDKKETKKTAAEDQARPDAEGSDDGITLADGCGEDLEVEIWKAVKARELAGGGRPDPSALRAMEEPLKRLMGAAALLHDLACALDTPWDARPMGLLFIAGAMQREAQRLYRLHYGRWPRGG